MSPALAEIRTDRAFPSVQTLLAGCAAGGPFRVDGFPRYENTVASLPPNGRRRLAQIADVIVRSYRPECRPVRTVQVYGHADWDTPRNFRREMQISEQRAERVADWLRTRVGPSLAARITWDLAGFAATQLTAPPITELNRRRNRRAEIFLLPQVGLPPCSCLLPGHPHFNTWLQSGLRRVLRSPQVRVDGVFSPQTQTALRRFQARSGLAPTGRMNRATYLKLLTTGTGACPVHHHGDFPALMRPFRNSKPKSTTATQWRMGWGFRAHLRVGSQSDGGGATLEGRVSGLQTPRPKVSAQLCTRIFNAGTGRCCVAEYRRDLPDTIKKLREALDDGFLIVPSVLSGACTGQGSSCSDRTCCDVPGPRPPFPDHWVLIIGTTEATSSCSGIRTGFRWRRPREQRDAILQWVRIFLFRSCQRALYNGR
jgi:peptidoglycan hydrolase-like protein with peptidoglycan-binding domain